MSQPNTISKGKERKRREGKGTERQNRKGKDKRKERKKKEKGRPVDSGLKKGYVFISKYVNTTLNPKNQMLFGSSSSYFEKPKDLFSTMEPILTHEACVIFSCTSVSALRRYSYFLAS